MKRKKFWVTVVILILVVVGGGIAFLPYFLTSDNVKDTIASALSDVLQRPVQIESISASWEGVVLHDLSVMYKDDQSASGEMALIRIKQIQTPFKPDELMEGRIDWLRMEGVDCFLQVDQDGQILLPEFVMAAGQVDIEHVDLDAVSISLVDQVDRELQLGEIQLGHVFLGHDNQAGTINWAINADEDAVGAAIRSGGYVTVRNEKAKGAMGPADFCMGRFTFNDFDLAGAGLVHLARRAGIVNDLKAFGSVISADGDFRFGDDGGQVVISSQNEHFSFNVMVNYDQVTDHLKVNLLEGAYHGSTVQGRLVVGQAVERLQELEKYSTSLTIEDVINELDRTDREFVLEFSAATTRIDDFIKEFPVEETLFEGMSMSGSEVVRLSGSLSNDKPYQIELSLPVGVSCTYEMGGQDYFKKADDKELTLLIRSDQDGILFDDDGVRVDQIDVEVGYGQSQFVLGAGRLEIVGDWPEVEKAVLNGPWRVNQIEGFVDSVGAIDDWFGQMVFEVEGRASGDMAVMIGKGRGFIESEMNVGQLEVAVRESNDEGAGGLVFSKPYGLAGQILSHVSYSDESHASVVEIDFEIDQIEGLVESTLVEATEAFHGVNGILPSNASFNVHVGDVKRLSNLFPIYFKNDGAVPVGQFDLCHLSGEADFNGMCEFAMDGWDLELAIDATKVACDIEDASVGDDVIAEKRDGVACLVEADLSYHEEQNLFVDLLPVLKPFSSGESLAINRVTVTYGGSKSTLSGRLTVPEGGFSVWRIHSVSQAREIFNQGRFEIDSTLSAADRALVRGGFGELIDALGMQGTVGSQLKLQWDDTRRYLICTGQVDMTSAGLRVDVDHLPITGDEVVFNKLVDDSMVFDFEMGRIKDTDSLLFKTITMTMDEVMIESQAVVHDVDLEGYLTGRKTYPAESVEVAVHVDAENLERLRARFDSSVWPDMEGHTRFDMAGYVTLGDEYELVLRQVKGDGDIITRLADTYTEIQFDGLEVTRNQFVLPSLYVRLGESEIHATAGIDHHVFDLDMPGEIVSGRVDFYSERLNAVELEGLLPGVDGTVRRWFTDAEIEQAADLIRRCDVDGTGRMVNVDLVYPGTDAQVRSELVVTQFKIGPEVKVDYSAAIHGGVVKGDMVCDMTVPHVVVRHSQTIRDVKANTSIQPIVESEFPGLIVRGKVNEEYQWEATLKGLLNGVEYWQGRGVTALTDGVLYGPGGAEWLVKMIPTLETVAYPWERVANTYVKHGDGRKENELLFSGTLYDVYMKGVSTAVDDEAGRKLAMTVFEADLQRKRNEVKGYVERGEDSLGGEEKLVMEQLERMEDLWKRHEDGELVRISQADYEVGLMVARSGGDGLALPVELMRIPAFYFRGTIVGTVMVGVETRGNKGN